VRDSPKQSLIVGYDGSEPARRALEHAADLVGRGAILTVINVISVQSLSSRLQTVSDNERAKQDRLLLEAEMLLTRRGVNADLVRAAGDPATEILSAAASMAADVIVVGRRRGTSPRLIHGSLSNTLVRKAASDVLVVH
jgi:nucleotide-binding universal stress UspA family protein